MALTDNLISVWELDEASGNAIDSHGTNDLTDTNTVGAGSGPGAGAGELTASRDFEADNDEYFAISDNADLSFGDEDFTISCWIYLETTGGGFVRTLVAKSNNTSGAAADIEYALLVWTDSIVYLDVSNGSIVGEVGATTEGGLDANTWYHIVTRHDATANTLSLVINNGTVDSVSYSGGCTDGTFPFEIGRGVGGSREMDGLIAQVAIWGRAITNAEVAQLYNSGAGLAYSEWAVVAASPPPPLWLPRRWRFFGSPFSRR